MTHPTHNTKIKKSFRVAAVFAAALFLLVLSGVEGSFSPFSLPEAHAAVSTYDFVACGTTCDTGTGTWASVDDVDLFPFGGVTANRNSHTEATDAQYDLIESSNNATWNNAGAGNGDYYLAWIEQTIAEATATITNVTFTFDATSTGASAQFCLLKAAGAASWQTDSNWVCITPYYYFANGIYTYSTSSVNEYVSATGLITWAMWAHDINTPLTIDYVKIDVTYSTDPNLSQVHYRWKDDSTSESTNTWLANEDTSVSVYEGEGRRLRMSVKNTGSATSSQFRLEYATSSGASVWTQIGNPTSTSAHWVWIDSSNLTDGASSTDNAGLSNDSMTFTSGQVKDAGNQTGAISLDDRITELEYSITATTTAIDSQVYYFRVTRAGATSSLSYTVYASATAAGPVPPANLTQIHYRWRNNDGDETSATWAAATNTPISGVVKQTVNRLRFEVSNEGGTSSASTAYRIEYATSSGASVWTPVGSSSASTNHWVMIASSLTEASNTSNVANGLDDANASFLAGRQLETSNQSAAITLTGTQFTEFEYAISATTTAIDGQTYYFRLTNAGTAIDTYAIYASATVVIPANLTQIHYRWRNNDGDETSATWAAATNTPISGVVKQTVNRLRFEVSNEGGTSSASTAYRIEYATSSGASVWTPVGSSSASTNHWVMIASSLTEASNTSNVSNGLDDANASFLAGRQLETSNQSAAITLTGTQFTEFEYAISATTTAIDGQTYYFRLTNAGTAIDTYTIYASATVVGPPDLTQIHYRWRSDDGGEPAKGGLVTSFDVDGIVDGSSSGWAANDIAIDSTYMYVVGGSSTAGTSNNFDWRIEKRRLDNGAGDSSFGSGGAVVGSSTSESPHAVVIDSTYMYVVGVNSGGGGGRIEKRRLDTGAGDTSFGTNGVVAASFYGINDVAIAIDSTYMYVVGTATSSLDWYIEKRRLDTGALDSAFGTNGAVLGSSTSNAAEAIAIDSTYMYVVGNNGSDWRIEKRRLDTGAGDTSFGSSGVVTGNVVSESSYAVAIDSTYMYVVGYGNTNDWRIEKRLLSTGALDSAFGASGVVTGSSTSYIASDITIDASSGYAYVLGSDGADWRIEKRRLDTGAGDTSFGSSGVVTGSPISASPNAIAIDASSGYMYVAGASGTSPYDWRIEKRSLGDGATWLAAEDQPITGVVKQATKRLRFEVSNEGDGTSASTAYRLEYSTSTSGGWTQVGSATSATAHWVMADSSFLTDGDSTTNVASGLTDANTTFEPGQIKDISNQTAGIILASTEFTELEYAITATTTAIDGQTYYFRLTNAGSVLDTYAIYASATIGSSVNLTQIHYRWRDDDGGEAAPGNAWGKGIKGATAVSQSISAAMGGTSPEFASMTLKSITIYASGTGDIRLGVYTGGGLSSPSSSALLWDAGTINPNGVPGWYTVNHPSGGVAWPTATTTWLAFKHDNGSAVTVYRNTTVDDDFQESVGSSANGFTTSSAVAFPATGGTGATSTSRYSLYVSYETPSGGVGDPTFGVAGVVTGSSTTTYEASDVVLDDTHMYVVGTTGSYWRIEKRRLDNGAGDPSFGTDGGITGSSTSGLIGLSIAIDSTYMYVAGYSPSTGTFRIEKRRLDTGASDVSFGSSGAVLGTASATPNDIAIDSTHMYVVGASSTGSFRDFIIEKRRLDTGALDPAFGTNGVVMGSSTSDTADGIAIDSTYMYVAGDSEISAFDWRIEKRLLSNGAGVSGFGTNGVVSGSSSSNGNQDIAIDSTYMYIVGHGQAPDTGMRIEKRRLDTGAGDTSFGSSGVVTSLTGSQYAWDVAIDSTYMYVSARPSDFDWRVEKRLLTSGAPDTSFGSSGMVFDSLGQFANGIAIDSAYMYVVGGDATSDFRIGKRLLTGGDGATWLAAEDQPITNVSKQTTKRLRFEVSNEGGGTSDSTQYRLEYSTSTTGGWAQVGSATSATAHWVMAASAYFTDGASTTDVLDGASSALTNTNTTFEGGQIKDTGNQTAGIILSNTEFTELEYAITATTTAIDEQAYYFRLTDAGTPIDTYTIYASATLAGVPAADLTQIHYRWRNDNGGETEGVGGAESTSTVTMHPIDGTETYTAWTAAAGCTENTTEYDCMNDQTGNTATGTPESNDGDTSRLTATGAASSSFHLADSAVPSNATVTDITFTLFGAEVSAAGGNATVIPFYKTGGTYNACAAALSFGGTTYTSSSCTLSGLSLTQSDLNAMEIGIGWAANDPKVTQLYIDVLYSLPGSSGTPAATFTANQDTPTSSIVKQTPIRLRIEVSNEGDATSSATAYQLQYATSAGASTWIAVGTGAASTAHWVMAESSNFTDGDATSDIDPGLSNANTTFDAGQLKDTDNESANITLSTTEFTELEYSITATTTAIDGQTYYFRVGKSQNPSSIGTYAIYASATIAGSSDAPNLTQIHYRWRNDNGGEGGGGVGGSYDTAFGPNGVATSTSPSVTAYGVAVDSTYMYVVGQISGSWDWRIEKRLLSNGLLCTAANCGTQFGVNGELAASSTSNLPQAIAIDSTYMYVVGSDTNNYFRIEKRLLSTGAGDVSFGTDGVVTGSTTSATARAIAIDSTYMYVVGYDDANAFRIEKRLLSNGAGDPGFGTGGIVTGSSTANIAYGIAIDSTYMYVVGQGDQSDWFIEKRLLSTGALDTSFDSDGVVVGSSTSQGVYGIAIDSANMYVVGADSAGYWRIEKRLLSTGAGVSSFGTNGVITGSSTWEALAIAIDSTYMYVVGREPWGGSQNGRIEKRLLSTGALDTSFGTNGVVGGVVEVDRWRAIDIDSTFMYVAGSDDSIARWRVEKLYLGGATWAAAEDQPITDVAKQTTKRLRFEVSNEGTATSSATQYRLEYATSTGAATWTQVGSGGSPHWSMSASVYFTDGASTTDVLDGTSSALTNANATFNAGQIKDTGSESGAVTLATTELTELEYSIVANAAATDGGTYYFRLTNAGTALTTYTIYASATLVTVTSTPASGSGTLVSHIFDTQRTTGAALNSIIWQGYQPAGTAVKFQIAAATSSGGPWEYRGPSCTTSAADTYVTGGANVPMQVSKTCHNNKRYFRYKIILEADAELTVSPRVDSIILNWSP